MSSDRNVVYCAPPPPPILPLLFNELPPFAPLTAGCALVTICTCAKDPEQELLEARNVLWQREGTPEPPHISFYRYIEPVLQEGPKCGLVALSMASLCTHHPLSVDHIFQEARLRGFTNHGEMFSVDNMAILAKDLLRSCREVEILSNGLQEKDYIISHIVQGGVLLVPYDADANHAPCCRQGHKAHWAIVSGVLSSQQGWHVVARQGKSRYLAVWSYDDLRRSNENLLELDPARAIDGRVYVLPSGGVSAGLRGRVILLHGLGMQ